MNSRKKNNRDEIFQGFPSQYREEVYRECRMQIKYARQKLLLIFTLKFSWSQQSINVFTSYETVKTLLCCQAEGHSQLHLLYRGKSKVI